MDLPAGVHCPAANKKISTTKTTTTDKKMATKKKDYKQHPRFSLSWLEIQFLYVVNLFEKVNESGEYGLKW